MRSVFARTLLPTCLLALGLHASAALAQPDDSASARPTETDPQAAPTPVEATVAPAPTPTAAPQAAPEPELAPAMGPAETIVVPDSGESEDTQPYDGPPTLLGPGHAALGGYGGLSVGYTHVNGAHGVLVVGEGAFLIDHRLAIGVAGYGLAKSSPRSRPT